MAADLVTIATTAALTQFVGPMFKHLGEQALERAKQVASKATGLLASVGREPQPVEPKLLVPLVQAAALETDETLAAKWAALLANAADPAQQVAVQVAFVEMLRQLTADDAQVLLYIETRSLSEMLHPERALEVHAELSELYGHFDWPSSRIKGSLDNLLRLRLAEAIAGDVYGAAPSLSTSASVALTTLGRQFLQAVAPPTS